MNQLVLIFISFFVFLTDASIMAQADSVKVRYGEVIILADSAIVKLERTTRKFKEVKGYRVQIFLGSLEETKGERNKYLSLGLPYSAYIKQIVPEHALQIGDFSNRLDLDKCLKEIEEYYPNAIAVVSAIESSKGPASAKSPTDKN